MNFLKLSVRDMFLSLTRHTVVYGEEEEYYNDLLAALGFEKDDIGNYKMVVGEGSTTMFCAHLDTAASKTQDVTHIQTRRYITTDGKTILGADDKAGVVVLMKMIEAKVPGLYYLFIGEEVGRKGSEAAADKYAELFRQYKKAIAFDRRGYDSIITRQSGTDCVSTAFANALEEEMARLGLFMKKDPTGSFTDTYSFTHLIPECTNLSIGYNNAHMTTEVQDVYFLEQMVRVAIAIDWEALPAERIPVAKWSGSSYSSYGGGTYYGGRSVDRRGAGRLPGDDEEDDEDLWGFSLGKENPGKQQSITFSGDKDVLSKTNLYDMVKDKSLAVEKVCAAVSAYLKTFDHGFFRQGMVQFRYVTVGGNLYVVSEPLDDVIRTIRGVVTVLELAEATVGEEDTFDGRDAIVSEIERYYNGLSSIANSFRKYRGFYGLPYFAGTMDTTRDMIRGLHQAVVKYKQAQAGESIADSIQ